jgi:hypothetical protein
MMGFGSRFWNSLICTAWPSAPKELKNIFELFLINFWFCFEFLNFFEIILEIFRNLNFLIQNHKWIKSTSNIFFWGAQQCSWFICDFKKTQKYSKIYFLGAQWGSPAGCLKNATESPMLDIAFDANCWKIWPIDQVLFNQLMKFPN